MYVNSHDGKVMMEDYLTRDVVRWTDQTFRTLADPRDRAILGLSDGGQAAVNLAFKHPDVFGACGSHSGDFRLRRRLGERKILGHGSAAKRILADNSPLDYVERVAPRLAGMVIYFDCGEHDGDLRENQEFDRKLEQLGVPHEFRTFPGGHSWSYWRVHLRDSLRALTAHMPALSI